MQNLNVLTTVTVGKLVFTRHEDVEWNRNKYSKAYHRKFGAVKEVSNRRVTIEKIDGRAKGGKKLLATVAFDAWRGNVLLAVIKESGLFTVPTSKAPMSVRLDKFYDAEPVRQIGHIKLWNRTLLGEHVDYVAVLNGVTYHDSTIRRAVKGLHAKIKAVAKKRDEPISWKLCKELGFCDTGIKEFCDTFNLDVKGTYAPAYIEELVKSDTDKAIPFERELRIVAKTLNYQPSI